jgi:hypothetical protein
MSDDREDGTYEGVVNGRPGFPPGDGFAPGDAPYAPGNAGSARSGRGADTESYEPSSYGRQAARDGYDRDGYSDVYEERGQEYGERTARGQGYARGYEQPAIGYGSQYDKRNKSYDDLGDRDYKERRKVEKYQRDDRYRDDSRDRDRSRPRSSRKGRSRTRSRSESDDDDEGERGGGENTEVMKWGATLAGAAIGGFTGHKAKKEGYIGTAVGAIVGGLVAREAEKEIYKRKNRKREERGMESESYRSKSR